MTDIFDQATELEQLQRDAALDAQHRRAAVREGKWREISAKWCEGPGCGVRIPDERRRAIPGVELCVGCQTRREQQERQRR